MITRRRMSTAITFYIYIQRQRRRRQQQANCSFPRNSVTGVTAHCPTCARNTSLPSPAKHSSPRSREQLTATPVTGASGTVVIRRNNTSTGDLDARGKMTTAVVFTLHPVAVLFGACSSPFVVVVVAAATRDASHTPAVVYPYAQVLVGLLFFPPILLFARNPCFARTHRQLCQGRLSAPGPSVHTFYDAQTLNSQSFCVFNEPGKITSLDQISR